MTRFNPSKMLCLSSYHRPETLIKPTPAEKLVTVIKLYTAKYIPPKIYPYLVAAELDATQKFTKDFLVWFGWIRSTFSCTAQMTRYCGLA